MKNMARLGITLMLICAAAGLGLAVVYAKTKPVIDQRAQEELLAAVRAAMPDAEEIVEETKDGETYWLGKKAGEIVGGAIKVSSAGFREPIELMVGFNAEGKVSSVAIISLNDTPGIGTRVNDKAWLDKFIGVENPMAVDAITGATVSSSAVKGAVKKAMDFMAAIVAPSVTDGPIDIARVPDGTYTGKGLGLRELEVSVTVQGGKIVEVKVTRHEESPGIADPAITGVPKKMVEQNKVDVDVVSGATFTSEGIIEAVKNALRPHVQTSGKPALDISKIADGTYTATGLGLKELEVAVTVQDGKITEVKVVRHDETPGISDPAISKVPKAIVDKQSVKVDVVSGATFTSEGIMEAVEKALAGAPTK